MKRKISGIPACTPAQIIRIHESRILQARVYAVNKSIRVHQ
jgi:hypothetical protein